MEIVKTVRLVMVPRAGVEPARPYGQRILSPQRLPFRHPGTRVKIPCERDADQTGNIVALFQFMQSRHLRT